jgi:DNA-binding MarR family transcriptional regulator
VTTSGRPDPRQPTARQIELVCFMSAHRARTGVWPTHRQMAGALGLNTTNLTPYLDLLEAKGLLERVPGAACRNRALTTLGTEIATRKEWPPSAP